MSPTVPLSRKPELPGSRRKFVTQMLASEHLYRLFLRTCYGLFVPARRGHFRECRTGISDSQFSSPFCGRLTLLFGRRSHLKGRGRGVWRGALIRG